ncbi:ribosome-associated protein [Parashewanella spongiae]|uniref:Dual-action ribosomal maturation protein DarP n=1 Tax=Parashewanella spongiae TaxID=342950 RepID=A0A3A6TFH1_9GAMM|nr:ribosome biogenesis factor YjgA [Parashewanella spongiae]MCL1079397.1 ribosome-associated protein [Parashewanella spongiae]RJY07695.1 ribosome-associated protein [Parashewanella spongiae]
MKIIDEAELNKQPYDNHNDYISRTEDKRESDELQEFGLTLLKYSKKELLQLDLEERLYDCLIALMSIKQKTEAYRRQLQLLGKIMRQIDIDELKRSLTRLRTRTNNQSVQEQRVEKMQQQLLSEGDQAIQHLVEQHSNLDRQKLRQLVRKSNKEIASGKESKAAKELFKYLQCEAL